VGTTSANFLKILPHARPAAMGEAYSAMGDDEGSFSYNPAGIADNFETQISATHIDWFQAMRLEHLGGVLPLGWLGREGSAGLYVTWLQIDPMDKTVPNAPLNQTNGAMQSFSTIGNFAPHDLLMGAVYALPMPWYPRVNLGLQADFIQQNIDVDNGWGLSGVLGAQYVNLLENLDAGLAVRNLGMPVQLGSQPFGEPITLNGGLTYYLFQRSLGLSAEFLAPVDNMPEYSMGGEYWYAGLLAFRAGYKAGYLNQYTAGAGVVWQGIKLDYAFVPYGELGYTHRITATYAFGAPEVNLSANLPMISGKGMQAFRETALDSTVEAARQLQAWTVTLKDETGQPVRTWQGSGLPPRQYWDGKDAQGLLKPDGNYTARLEAHYAKGSRALSRNVPVVLDSTPPDLNLTVDKNLLQPDEEGTIHIPATFSTSMSDLHGIGSWRLDILDSKGGFFRTWTGKGPAPDKISWDGSDGNGKMVSSGSLYTVQLTAQDPLGNWSRTKPLAEVVLLREIHITLSKNLVFDTGKATIKARYYSSLKEVADLIDKYRDSHGMVEIVGHTDNRPIHTAQFKNNVELSKARAQAVADKLENLYGVPHEFLKADGKGETQPVDTNDTEEGRQNNRRVEITIHTKEYK
jgi:flagellar motor protein MotB